MSEVFSVCVCETVIKDITFSDSLRSKIPRPKSNASEKVSLLSLWLAVPEMKLAFKFNLSNISDYHEEMFQISKKLAIGASNIQMKEFTQRIFKRRIRRRRRRKQGGRRGKKRRRRKGKKPSDPKRSRQ